jgi:uncharacterized repeat protein (TIGR03833 family)
MDREIPRHYRKPERPVRDATFGLEAHVVQEREGGFGSDLDLLGQGNLHSDKDATAAEEPAELPIEGEVMVRKKIDAQIADAGALTHHPFARLASNPGLVANLANRALPTTVIRVQPAKPPPPAKLRLRLETTGRSGKAVTRITGLPTDNLAAIASRLRKALGCGATVDGDDLLLLGSLIDRASQWLERAGDLRTIADQPTPSDRGCLPEAPAREAPDRGVSRAVGTNRSDVRRGQRVAIVMKPDQESGSLTHGIVAELLTNSATHPRGIKVRLESGEVGRVKIIYT